MNKNHGVIVKESKAIQHTIDTSNPLLSIKRNDSHWTVDLAQVMCLSAKTDSINERIIKLHKRMGHPSLLNMKSAIRSIAR